MEIDVKKMIKNKRDFIRSLAGTLRLDKARNNVRYISYRYDALSPYKELIKIVFENDYTVHIKADGNSNAANLKEITNAVYGGPVTGLIPHYTGK